MKSREAFSVMPQENHESLSYETVCIAPDGVQFGEGTVSASDRAHDGAESPVTPEQLHRAVEVLIQHRDEILVPVEADDDGCGDGRPTEIVFQLNDDAPSQLEEHHTSKNRAKIFGGGLQVAGSMWRAAAGQPANGETVLADRTFMASELKKRGIKYGIHSDSHAHGQNCGCGAIDKYTLSTKLSGVYRSEITETTAAFADGPSVAGLAEAFAVRATICRDDNYMANAAGSETMEFAQNDGAVIKRLGGPHYEMIDFINDQEGMTVDQRHVAEVFAAAGLPANIQVFVIDTWRGRMYADVVAEVATEHGFDREAMYDTALADFFINQLSVSAALTDGSQPVIYHRAVA